MQIEIDNGSGFCFGVTTAIKKAEEELEKGGQLYCLGDIVHNGMEVERLHHAGLITINHKDMEKLHHVKVLLRAHGEPPETYALAEQNHIDIIAVAETYQAAVYQQSGCADSHLWQEWTRRGVGTGGADCQQGHRD